MKKRIYLIHLYLAAIVAALKAIFRVFGMSGSFYNRNLIWFSFIILGILCYLESKNEKKETRTLVLGSTVYIILGVMGCTLQL